MGTLLILDKDPLERRFIAAVATGKYGTVIEAGDMKAAMKVLNSRRKRPTLIVAALDLKYQDTLLLLQCLHNSHSSAPVVAIAKGAARGLESTARSLGVRFFVHNPGNASEIHVAMQQAVRSTPHTPTPEPPITSEESSQNISVLVNHLNETMKCHAGSGRVFLHSFIKWGQQAVPRVCLRCPIRVSLGLPDYVYYEHIRDLCCGTPGKCEAMNTHRAEAR